jgi:hypothetical protein
MIFHNQHYLITARHVLEDTAADEEGILFDKIFIVQNGSDAMITNTKKIRDEDVRSPSMINLISAGPSGSRPYLLTSKEDDLCIINLDAGGTSLKRFYMTLDSRDYKAIELKDIDTACQIKEGQPILAFGFPGEQSNIAIKSIPHSLSHWESPEITIPSISTGTIEDALSGNNKFYGSIFVTHGFSGGPIISSNRLVGIVNGSVFPDHTLPARSLSKYRQVHMNLTKSSLLISLIHNADMSGM